MKHDNRPIGVFDSGCGGLTVLRVLQARFPHENFVYYADTAHVPYGTKSPAEIIAYSHAALSWLQDVAKVKLIVVACHTSSAIALEAIQNQFSVPIIGTIDPLVNMIMKHESNYKNIGIIATPASAASCVHARQLYAHDFNGTILSIPCPDFVPLIEAANLDVATITHAARGYFVPIIAQQCDTLVYGCTHYPLIASIIESVLPAAMQYIDPAHAIADAVAQHPEISKHKNRLHGTTQFYCSGDSAPFGHKIARFMTLPPEQILLKKAELF